MALEKKLEALASLDGDIAVIQECSQLSIETLTASDGMTSYWLGENKNKGLGVLVRYPWKIVSSVPMGQEWIARCEIHGPVNFSLFAVWACRGPKTEKGENRYIRQVHSMLDALKLNEPLQDFVIAGDFNANKRWDEEHRERSHSEAVRKIEKLGGRSAYHLQRNEAQGSEALPTIYHLKKREKPFHIDYVFLSERFQLKLSSVEVGKHDEWIALSDHMPMMVDLHMDR